MIMKIEGLFNRVRDGAILPKYAHDGDSGLDVCVPFDDDARTSLSYIIQPDETRAIPIGWRMSPPRLAEPFQVEFQLRPRSGLSLKTSLRIANAPGTVDSQYQGEVAVIVENTGATSITLSSGDKIAQLVCAPVIPIKVSVVSDDVFFARQSSRKDGGFGSTGTSYED